MNIIAASMLKEHGAQRPSVFEILQHVHNLRGTKSKFSYSIPAKEPLSPRSLQAPLQALSPNIAGNPLDELVSYKSQQAPPKNAGVEAREKVLEAIAPMRRGRPPQGQVGKPPSRAASPEKPVAFDTKFGDEDDRAWKGLRAARSGLPSLGADSASLASKGDTDAWSIGSRQSAQKPELSERRAFDNDFSSSFGSKFSSRSPPTNKPVEGSSSGFGSGFGDAFDPSRVASASSSQSQSQPSTRPPLTQQPPSRYRQSRIGKDAFDGLGLSAQPQAPTLGEARMSRTGLASFGSSSASSSTPYNFTPPTGSGLGTSNTTYRPPSARPTPSPQPLSQPPVQPQLSNLSPIPPPTQTWRQHVQAPSSSQSQEGLSAEERFPSLEDLDRTFGSPSPGVPVAEKAPPLPSRSNDRPPSRSSYMGATGHGTGNHGLTAPGGVKGRFDGVRSQQVTGTAMRDARAPGPRQSTFMRNVESVQTKTDDGPSKQPLASRPSLSRKHRSSVSMKTAAQAQPSLLSGQDPNAHAPPSLPPRPRAEPQDWLTGTDEPMGGPLGSRSTGLTLSQPQGAQPVLRESPSKRASYIERSPVALQKPLEAESVLPAPSPVPQAQSAVTELEREWNMALDRLDQIPAGKSERERREKEKAKEREREKRRSRSKSKSPVPMSAKAFITRNDVSTAGLGLQIPSGTGARQSTTPSPSGLTDNWSPVSSPKRRGKRTQSPSKQGSMSSSGDEDPEDVNGYVPQGGMGEKTKELEKVASKGGMHFNGSAMVPPADGQRRRRTRSKGRQSSVHDLVDLWGGGVEKSKSPTERASATAPGKRNSVIVPASTMKPPPLANKPRSSSPQPMGPPASPSKHAKQASSAQQPTGGSRRLPMPPAATPEPPTPSGRSRPASMFIAPVSASRSTPAEMGIPSSSEAAASFAQQALSPPDTPRSRKGTRRSSISNMVQRYEAIGSSMPKGQGSGPPAPSKPAALSLKTQTQSHQSKPSTASSDLVVPSPSSAATRFPKLSPTSSPVLAKASLAVPEDTGRSQYGRDYAKHRTSPTGLPSRSSPVGRLETPYSSSFNPSPSSHGQPPVNGLPSRRSPLSMEPPRDQPSRASIASTRGDIGMGPPPSPKMERKVSGTANLEVASQNPNLRSPSPEKPYQGVSKLIDRWQRAVDETAPAGLAGPGGARRGGVPPQKAGMVSGGSRRS